MELRWCQHANVNMGKGGGDSKEFLLQCYSENISTLQSYSGLVNIFAKQRPVVRGLAGVSRGGLWRAILEYLISPAQQTSWEPHLLPDLPCCVGWVVFLFCFGFFVFQLHIWSPVRLIFAEASNHPNVHPFGLLEETRRPDTSHRKPKSLHWNPDPLFYYLPSNWKWTRPSAREAAYFLHVQVGGGWWWPRWPHILWEMCGNVENHLEECHWQADMLSCRNSLF